MILSLLAGRCHEAEICTILLPNTGYVLGWYLCQSQTLQFLAENLGLLLGVWTEIGISFCVLYIYSLEGAS